MQRALIVRLVDITLLLLLSLMAVASIDPYSIEPPHSEALIDQGILLHPLQVAVAAEGVVHVYNDAGHLESVEPAALAAMAAAAGQSVEVVADYRAPAHALLSLYRALEVRGIPSAFLVERTQSSP